jgi:hypothetical protein
MKKETLTNILSFIEKVDGSKISIVQKIKNGLPLTEDELNIDDDLNLVFSKLTSLPEGLKVGGDLLLLGTPITSLPEGLTVGGDLFLDYSKITSLPEGLKVGLNLYISKTPLKKYTDEQLREMVKPGFIQGKINR